MERIIDPSPAATVLFLQQSDQPGMAILVRNQSEEIRCLERDLEYEIARRKFAEKAYLEEVDKNWFERLFR